MLPNKGILNDDAVAKVLIENSFKEKCYAYDGGEMTTLDVTKLLKAQQQADFKAWAKWLFESMDSRKRLQPGEARVNLKPMKLSLADFEALRKLAEAD